VAFVGYGNVGGARAVDQLRLVSIELEMAPLRHAVHILPDVMRPVRAAGVAFDVELFASLDQRLEMLATDLSWWADALRQARTAAKHAGRDRQQRSSRDPDYRSRVDAIMSAEAVRTLARDEHGQRPRGAVRASPPLLR
jgi:hypothetical protein